MNTIDFLTENGFCITDKICVFCSFTTDGWNAICPRCNDYKGMMRITEAVDYYGTDVLPI